MKSKSALFVLITCSFLTSLAFGGPQMPWTHAKNSANLELNRAVMVGDTKVPAGQYKLAWEGNGPEVTVILSDGKKTVATTSARFASAPTSSRICVETDTSSGTPVLRAIDMKDGSLRFDNSVAAQGN